MHLSTSETKKKADSTVIDRLMQVVITRGNTAVRFIKRGEEWKNIYCATSHWQFCVICPRVFFLFIFVTFSHWNIRFVLA